MALHEAALLHRARTRRPDGATGAAQTQFCRSTGRSTAESHALAPTWAGTEAFFSGLLVERSGPMIVGRACASTTEQVPASRLRIATSGRPTSSAYFRQRGAQRRAPAGPDFVREGNMFWVTRLDRLARSAADLLEIVARLDRKGVMLRMMELSLDTSTSTDELMSTVMGQHRRI